METHVPAYLMSEVRLINPTLADKYRALSASSIAAHGGEYLARGVTPEAIEGEWPTEHYMVLVKFPDITAVKAWYTSPEYADALALSRGALSRRLLIIDGYVPPQSGSAASA